MLKIYSNGKEVGEELTVRSRKVIGVNSVKP